MRLLLLKANAVVTIPSGHVRQDDLITGLQPFKDLDGGDRTLAEFDRNAHRMSSVLDQLEQCDGPLLLTENRTTDMDHVLEVFELDGSIDAEVGSNAFGQLALEGHVHRDSPVLNSRVDTNNPSRNMAVASVDVRCLAILNILGPGFSNLHFSF